tara:strand:+ start:24 stop:704 length:681 start_codon:yes stop_codon:yes gene_type:complete
MSADKLFLCFLENERLFLHPVRKNYNNCYHNSEKGHNKHKEEQSDAGGEEEEEQELIDAYYELLQIPKDQVVAPEEWKQLYYERKFAEQCGESGFRSQLCHEYLRGVVWVLKYYYDGVMSWNWFYPYHYAPLVSDLVNTSSFEFDFELSKPFPPLCQLLGVLSPLSGKLLPKPYRELMTNPRSTLLELYPEAFEVEGDLCLYGEWDILYFKNEFLCNNLNVLSSCA